MGASVILWAFGDSPDKYWSLVFTGMIIGMVGIGIAFVGVNVSVMASARKGEEVQLHPEATLSIALSLELKLMFRLGRGRRVDEHSHPSRRDDWPSQ